MAPQLKTGTAAVALVYHATLSPSGAEGWMSCAPKLAMEVGLPDSSSGFADEGTAAHFLASEALEQRKATASWLGCTIIVWSDAASHKRGTNWYGKDQIPASATRREYEVDHEMAGFVQNYVDAIYSRMEQFKLRGAVSVELLIEIRVEFSVFVGFPGQFGTSDAILLIEWPDGTMQVDVNDLKFGRGVRVNAADFELLEDGSVQLVLTDCTRGNKQMMIYALGAYDQYQALGDYTRASWCIHQPRLGHISEAECHIDDLLAWAADHLKPAAERAIMYLESRHTAFSPSDFTPGEKQCMWCKASGTCTAAAKHVFDSITGDFVDLDAEIADQVLPVAKDRIGHMSPEQLSQCMLLADFVEDIVKAWRARVESKLFQNEPVPEFKLVDGKQGNRAWISEQEAEAALKTFRLKQDQMYKFKVISPTDAEKLLAKDQPKRWTKLQSLIKRAPGKPSVAHISDKRPALVLAPLDEAFTNLGGDDGSDLA